MRQRGQSCHRVMQSSHYAQAIRISELWKNRKCALDTPTSAHLTVGPLYPQSPASAALPWYLNSNSLFSGFNHVMFLHSIYGLKLSSSFTHALFFTVCLTMLSIYCWWMNISGSEVQTSSKDTADTGFDTWMVGTDVKKIALHVQALRIQFWLQAVLGSDLINSQGSGLICDVCHECDSKHASVLLTLYSSCLP